jgi:hypothetical protein
MTTAVIGATGRVGGEIVRGVLAWGDGVAARRLKGLHIRPGRHAHR